MILYLYGPDSYRRRKKLKEIINKYLNKHSALTIENFDFSNQISEEAVEERLKDFISSQFLFDQSKLGIIANPSISKNLAEILKSILTRDSIHLILESDEFLGKDFDFLLKPPVLSQSFQELSPAQMSLFIKKEAGERNLDLSPKIINYLIQAYGSDTWAIVNELDKLALGGELDYTEVVPDFFVLLNRLRSREVAGKKIAALTWLLENEEPAAIFNILANQVNPDFKIKMADYDVAIKSGKLGYEEALIDLLI